jgi:hypothetical protein
VRLLLITPQFYGTEYIIKSVLEESEYEVTWIENKSLAFDYHGAKAKFRFLRRIYFLLFKPDIKYLKKELKKIEDLRFDILFSINAHIICPYLFEKLKLNNPSIRSILFLWDSTQKYDWTKEMSLFEKVYTFDLTDSQRYKIEYKPNFYVSREISTVGTDETDLFFAGKFTPDRLFIIDRLLGQSKVSGFKTSIKLWPAYKVLFHCHLIYLLLKKSSRQNTWIRNYTLNYEAIEGILDEEYLINESIPYSEVQMIAMNSNVILDIPFEGQSGYTHRVIEAMSRGQKVLTTNTGIRKEAFYNPEQVHIIDRNDPIFEADWIREKVEFSINECFRDMELKVWLKQIINAEAL